MCTTSGDALCPSPVFQQGIIGLPFIVAGWQAVQDALQDTHDILWRRGVNFIVMSDTSPSASPACSLALHVHQLVGMLV